MRRSDAPIFARPPAGGLGLARGLKSSPDSLGSRVVPGPSCRLQLPVHAGVQRKRPLNGSRDERWESEDPWVGGQCLE